MFPFRIFLCVSIFFVASFAYIPSESAKFNIFDSKFHSFERNLSQHINDFETKFKNEKDKEALLAPIGDALTNIANMLDGDWKATFLKATANADGSSSDTAKKYVITAKTQIKELKNKFSEFEVFKELRRGFGPSILAELNNILQQFNGGNSFFLSYPLISSPLLIELALVVALFHSILKGLQIEAEINKYRLQCLVYDLLFEYREYAVDSRLDKLPAVLVRDGEKHKIDMNKIATQKSEWTWIAKKLDPSIALSERAKIIADTYIEGEFKDDSNLFYCLNPQQNGDFPLKAIVDDFGEDKEKMWDLGFCAGEYATIVKERTEKMFPVSLFKQFCNGTQGNPTGMGYLTLRIKRIQAHFPYDDEDCDGHVFNYLSPFFSHTVRCDPFVQLYVGGENVWNSKAADNTALIEPNYTYRSKNPIKKDTRIEIRVMDENLRDPGLIESAEGTVTEFLNKRNRRGKRLGLFQNLIETFVMWKDECSNSTAADNTALIEPNDTIRSKKPNKKDTKNDAGDPGLIQSAERTVKGRGKKTKPIIKNLIG